MDENLEIRRWKGQSGAYARRDFEPGERVMAVEGEVGSEPSRYSIQISSDRHVHPRGDDTPWMYLNHSCNPNLAYDAGSRAFIAKEVIQSGEQLSFNYLTTEWDMAEGFECACGDDRCFGRIAGFRNLENDERARLLDKALPHIRILESERVKRDDHPVAREDGAAAEE